MQYGHRKKDRIGVTLKPENIRLSLHISAVDLMRTFS